MASSVESQAPTTLDHVAGLRVVAIAGYGRSGSTLLDRVLGNHPELVGVGELVNLHEEGWVAGHYCGCGRPVPDCELWESVRTAWLGGRDEAAITDFIARRRRWSTRLGLRSGNARNEADRGAMVADVRRLYDAIASASGRRVIVDSSKSPAWFDMLGELKDVDVRGIHLVRDGRMVASSLKKPLGRDVAGGVQHDISRRSVAHTALAWSVDNLSVERISRKHRFPILRLRYEDLLADPAAGLRRIGAFIGVDTDELAERARSGAAFGQTHTAAGGRMRMEPSISIEALPGRPNLTAWESAQFWLIAGIVAWRYGYRP